MRNDPPLLRTEFTEHGPAPAPVFDRASVERSARSRLLVRKLWRAFPELDSYSDADCASFVRLARRRARWRHAHAALIAIVFVGALVGALIVGNAFLERANVSPIALNSAAYVALRLATLIATVAVPAMLALTLRDWFLRKRVRWVLADSGSCGMCGYSLIGLPIPESLKLNCPECGFVCTVDESLSVLVRDDGSTHAPSGQRRVVMQRPPYWTPVRKRRWKRTILSSGASLLLLIGIPVVANEIWIRAQSAQAVRERPTTDEVTALIALHRPTLSAVREPEALSIMAAIRDEVALVRGRVRAEHGVDGRIMEDFSLIMPDPWELETPQIRGATGERTRDRDGSDANAKAEFDEQTRQYTTHLMAAFEASDLDALLQELRAAPRQVRDLACPPEELLSVVLRYLSGTRLTVNALSARARLAIARRDTATAEFCLSAIRAVSRHCCDQPTAVEYVVGASQELVGGSCVKRWLASKPSAQELAALERAWPNEAGEHDWRLGVDFHALMVRAAMARAFSQPDNTRMWLFEGIASLRPGGSAGALIKSPGTWTANRDAIEALRVHVHAEWGQEMHEAYGNAAPPAAPDLEGAGLAQAFQAMLSPANKPPIDALTQQRRALKVMFALEHWRLDKGGYPATLSELVPQYLAAVPNDTRSGKPLGYRRLEPGSDAQGRAYLLYSLGEDATDHEGRESRLLVRPQGSSVFAVPAGYDAQLNHDSPIPRDTPAP
ncbi:MAG: hypothetical protein JNK53_05435 [Phycisphaerae bacterium]|nr:hypothetical protein [Phycisphaerae bacterium]